MELSADQEKAEALALEWANSKNKRRKFFFLNGWAGTGKTTLARRLVEKIAGLENTVCAAPTGKAAYALRQRSNINAGTVHQVIYRTRASSAAKLEELLKKKFELESDPVAYEVELVKILAEIKTEEEYLKQPRFMVNEDSALKTAKLGLLDEASMIYEEMGHDWMSFGVPTIVLGDPGQLPPVAGTPYFTDADYTLTQIHRQAEGNPILELARAFRERRMPEMGRHGSSLVARRADLSQAEKQALLMAADAVIVGTNKSRKAFNQKIRTYRGFTGLPKKGERLVCLKNDHELGILNGALYDVLEDAEMQGDTVFMKLVQEDTNQVIEVHAHPEYFTGDEPDHYRLRDAACFDFGYALTCHKCQGSQFKNPLILDESRYLRNVDPYQWLYTATTRAQHSVTLLR